MTATPDSRADSTRQQILRAAARQFARLPYHQVGLDDVLAEAELTKGAMYFHFRSKHALALAIIEDQAADARAVVEGLVNRKFSGLETLIDFGYQIAVRDISTDMARAGFNLLESIGRVEGLQAERLEGWIQTLTVIAGRAVEEGDISDECDPQEVARLLVSIFMGLRQTSNLDDPEQFLLALEKTWVLLLPGIVRPERIDYFRQFIRRRTAIAIGSTSTLASSL
ncbi:MAG TPA: TetR/AcrR family transcriptional regulator [Mycobacterium sp.]|nr:TetR/AcrR family transcriptional regulator [Mycobacterium sp.]